MSTVSAAILLITLQLFVSEFIKDWMTLHKSSVLYATSVQKNLKHFNLSTANMT